MRGLFRVGPPFLLSGTGAAMVVALEPAGDTIPLTGADSPN